MISLDKALYKVYILLYGEVLCAWLFVYHYVFISVDQR